MASKSRLASAVAGTALVLAVCTPVSRPDGEGPVGPTGTSAPPISFLSPRSGDSVDRATLLGEPGLSVVVDVARLPAGGAVRFTARVAGAQEPFFATHRLVEPGRLTADALIRAPTDALETAASVTLGAAALDAGGSVLGQATAVVSLR